MSHNGLTIFSDIFRHGLCQNAARMCQMIERLNMRETPIYKGFCELFGHCGRNAKRGLLNRYRAYHPIGGSNPPLSASIRKDLSLFPQPGSSPSG
jgi:hypothetical protein